MIDGLHVPTIPFGEVVFNIGAGSLEHKVKVVAKSGVIWVLTVTTNVSGEAH